MKRILLILLFTNPLNADLISIDDIDWGVDSITFDTATNLQWLDVTRGGSVGFGEAAVTAATSSGGVLEGWRYASMEEVQTLYFHCCGFEDNDQAILDYIEIFGRISTGDFDQSGSHATYATGIAGLRYDWDSREATIFIHDQGSSPIHWEDLDAAIQPGVFLVRDVRDVRAGFTLDRPTRGMIDSTVSMRMIPEPDVSVLPLVCLAFVLSRQREYAREA